MKANTLQDDIHNYESRNAPVGHSLIKNYGSAGLGLDLTAEAWPSLTQAFISGGTDILVDTPNRPSCCQVAEL
jgi:hypothetical protein